MPNHAHTRSGALQESEAGFAAILRESGWISEKDLTAATEYAERAQMDLVEALVALRFLDEHDSYAALSIAAGVEFVDLNDAALSVLAIRLVPASLAFGRLVVPISVNNHVLTFATCRPFGRETKRELTLATGRQARMMVAQRSSVLDALQHCYPALDPAQSLTDMAEALGLDASAIQGISARAEVHTTTTIESAVPTPGVERPVRRHRVLVTDDDPVTRIVVKVLL